MIAVCLLHMLLQACTPPVPVASNPTCLQSPVSIRIRDAQGRLLGSSHPATAQGRGGGMGPGAHGRAGRAGTYKHLSRQPAIKTHLLGTSMLSMPCSALPALLGLALAT